MKKMIVVRKPIGVARRMSRLMYAGLTKPTPPEWTRVNKAGSEGPESV